MTNARQKNVQKLSLTDCEDISCDNVSNLPNKLARCHAKTPISGAAYNLYICKLCDYNTSIKHSYTRHLLSSKHVKNANSVQLHNCEICDYVTGVRRDYERHLFTQKHVQKMKNVQNVQNVQNVHSVEKCPTIFVCELCNYTTATKKHYKEHINTKKHQTMNNRIIIPCVDNTITETNEYVMRKNNVCTLCFKQFNSRQGLHAHKKSCIGPDKNTSVPNILLGLMKQNQEFKELIIEQTKQQEELVRQQHDDNQAFKTMVMELAQKENTIITNNNTQNNHFNLNMFLNEKCKDAMNFLDFVDSLQISFEELENMAHKGYVAGMSEIIMNGLKQLDVYHRPIHCTDIKRETMYVKDNNEWVKDDDQVRIKKVISIVAKKNMRNIRSWQYAHPNCEITDSKEQYLHMNIMKQCMNNESQHICGLNDGRIIKNIAKYTYLDRGRNITV